MKTGNVIASTIALLWGFGIVIHHFVGTSAAGSGAYASGRFAGTLFGLVLGLAGVRGIYKEIQRSQTG